MKETSAFWVTPRKSKSLDIKNEGGAVNPTLSFITLFFNFKIFRSISAISSSSFIPLGPTLTRVEPSSCPKRKHLPFIKNPESTNPKSGSLIPGVAKANATSLNSGKGILSPNNAFASPPAIVSASSIKCGMLRSSISPLIATPSGSPSASNKKLISAAKSTLVSAISLVPLNPKITSPISSIPNFKATSSKSNPGIPNGSFQFPFKSRKISILNPFSLIPSSSLEIKSSFCFFGKSKTTSLCSPTSKLSSSNSIKNPTLPGKFNIFGECDAFPDEGPCSVCTRILIDGIPFPPKILFKEPSIKISFAIPIPDNPSFAEPDDFPGEKFAAIVIPGEIFTIASSLPYNPLNTGNATSGIELTGELNFPSEKTNAASCK